MSDAFAIKERYTRRVTGGRESVAYALLDMWERPWSSRALRFAAHALCRMLVRGIDVLETPTGYPYTT